MRTVTVAAAGARRHAGRREGPARRRRLSRPCRARPGTASSMRHRTLCLPANTQVPAKRRCRVYRVDQGPRPGLRALGYRGLSPASAVDCISSVFAGASGASVAIVGTRAGNAEGCHGLSRPPLSTARPRSSSRFRERGHGGRPTRRAPPATVTSSGPPGPAGTRRTRRCDLGR